jgi:mRNA interferase RelE/StbE
VAYHIEITPTALEALSGITDERLRAAIVRRIDSLADGPRKQGRTLRGELAGFLSVRAASQRYRVVYGVDDGEQLVTVYLVGIRREGGRRDVYALAQRLVRRGWM